VVSKNRAVPRALALTLALLASSAVAAGEWSTFRGPRGTGEALDPLPPGDGALGLELVWKRPLGTGYSGISVAGDVLVTAFADADSDFVIALDVTSGEEIWRYELGPAYPGRDGSHDGPIATPAIAGGRVFAVDPAGKVVGLDLASGAERWTTDLVEELGSEEPYYGFAGSPVVVDGTLILQIGGEGGSVAGLDVDSGELLWRALEDGIAAQSPILAEIGGRRQILVLGSEKLAGIDPTDGTLLWEMAHEGEGGMGAATQSPVPLDNSHFFVKYATPEAAVFELAEVDGAIGIDRRVSSRGLTRSYSPATLAGGVLYGFTGRILSAVDPVSGELLWRTRDVGDGFAISIEDRLAILEKTGTLHLGVASPEGWIGETQLHLFDDLVWTPPSYANGAVYVRSLGEIARVDLVRTAPERLASEEAPEIPAALAGLAERVAAAEDAAAEVDRFLDGRSLPLIEGETVVFVWRGEAEDVAVAGDMIGMRLEEPMHRLEGTDLWWWKTEIDPRARMSYLFFADLEPTVDPSHDRVVTSTILGPDMNWQREEPVEMSWFAMPEWPGLAERPTEEPGARGRLEEIEITVQPEAAEGEEEAPEPVQVPTTVWLPPGYDESDRAYPVVYLLHADAFAIGDWAAALDRVVGDSVEPIVVVSPDLPRMPGLRGVLAEQIVPAIDQRYRTEAERDSRAVVGMGFPAYSAAIVGFRHSDTFGRLGLQSLFLTWGPMEERLQETIGEKTAETTPMRIYLEWGRWDLISPYEEMNFRDSGRWGWELFRDLGYEPLGGEVWDSTDFASWSNRTDVLLEALFPLGEGADTSETAWFTGSP
ncbi:MAG: PQQ-binding-like beta-propeller repeat protein, partial [Thermoanaerobaculia bacterium]|nr:PQQ-binding-like beta-propeller repeat protein [Thermoanaerobaculia bacterium]